jgi:hypothetical protein
MWKRRRCFLVLSVLFCGVGAIPALSQSQGPVRITLDGASGTLLISLGRVLVPASLCPVHPKRTMHESKVQIGNCGLP